MAFVRALLAMTQKHDQALAATQVAAARSPVGEAALFARCTKCYGTNGRGRGRGRGDTSILAGWRVAALEATLGAYRANGRDGAVMQQLEWTLNDAQMAALSRYFAAMLRRAARPADQATVSSTQRHAAARQA